MGLDLDSRVLEVLWPTRHGVRAALDVGPLEPGGDERPEDSERGSGDREDGDGDDDERLGRDGPEEEETLLEDAAEEDGVADDDEENAPPGPEPEPEPEPGVPRPSDDDDDNDEEAAAGEDASADGAPPPSEEEEEAASEEPALAGGDDDEDYAAPRARKRRRSKAEPPRKEIPEDDESRDFRSVTFRARDMNAHLVCRLCDGYFRDAHTITECLHTFCKGCLLAYLAEKNSTCPRCNVPLGPHPMNVILHDRTLQTLVDKIFPVACLPASSQKAAAKGEEQKRLSNLSGGDPETATQPQQPPGGASDNNNNDNDSSSRQQRARAPPKKKQQQQRDFNFKVEPHESQDRDRPLAALPKPYLKTNGALKVGEIRRYLAKKLNTTSATLELQCKDHRLPNEHSIDFIKRTLWFNDATDLVVTYRANDDIDLDVV